MKKTILLRKVNKTLTGENEWPHPDKNWFLRCCELHVYIKDAEATETYVANLHASNREGIVSRTGVAHMTTTLLFSSILSSFLSSVILN